MNQRKAGIILSYMVILLNSIINIAYVPLLLYYIGQNEFGLYKLMGAVAAYFSMMDFGLSSTIVRFYAKYKALNDRKNMSNVLAVSSMLYLFIMLVIIIASCCFYFNINTIFSASLNYYELQEAKEIFILIIVNMLFTILGQIFIAVITAYEKFVFLKATTLVQICIQPVVVVLMLQMAPSALSVVFVQTCMSIMLFICRAYYSKKKLCLHIHYYGVDRSFIKSIGSLSGSLFVVFLVDQIFWQSNQIILGMTIGTNIVAIYAVASQIYMNYMPISNVISSVFLPKVTDIVVNKQPIEVYHELMIKLGRIQFMLLGLVLTGFVVYGKGFIKLWVGDDFNQAYFIALCIMIPFTIDLIQNINLTFMQALNKYWFRAKIYSLMGLLNVIIAFPIAKIYGGIGCAILTGGLMFLGNGVIMNIYYYYVLKLPIVTFWRQILSMAIVMLITMFIGNEYIKISLYNDVINLVINVLLYIAIYIVALYISVMNEYEKNIIKEACIRLYKR